MPQLWWRKKSKLMNEESRQVSKIYPRPLLDKSNRMAQL
jgi:hypothetical protein